MKCLSLYQPWATLIAIGAKSIETRSWSTRYRGPILIHAAKRWDRSCSLMLFHPDTLQAWNTAGIPQGQRTPVGAVLAIADLLDCVQVVDTGCLLVTKLANEERIYPPEESFGNYTPGRWAWKLANIRRFKTPIPCVGHQRIFNVPDELVADQIRQAVPA